MLFCLYFIKWLKNSEYWLTIKETVSEWVNDIYTFNKLFIININYYQRELLRYSTGLFLQQINNHIFHYINITHTLIAAYATWYLKCNSTAVIVFLILWLCVCNRSKMCLGNHAQSCSFKLLVKCLCICLCLWTDFFQTQASGKDQPVVCAYAPCSSSEQSDFPQSRVASWKDSIWGTRFQL